MRWRAYGNHAITTAVPHDIHGTGVKLKCRCKYATDFAMIIGLNLLSINIQHNAFVVPAKNLPFRKDRFRS